MIVQSECSSLKKKYIWSLCSHRQLYKFAKATKSFKDIWICPVNHTENRLFRPETKTDLRIRDNNFYCSQTISMKKNEDMVIQNNCFTKGCGTQKGRSKTCILKLHANISQIFSIILFQCLRLQFENWNLFISCQYQHMRLKMNILNIYYVCFLDFWN